MTTNDPGRSETQDSAGHRPRSVAMIGVLFVVMGIIGFGYHLPEIARTGAERYEAVWVLALRLLAIVGGVFLLRGANWARWLLIAWLAYHVVLSARHSTSELITHAALLVVIGYVLVRPRASAYFHTPSQSTT